MFNRAEVKAQGLTRFKANYWPCVAVAVILALVSGGSGGSASSSAETSNIENMTPSEALMFMIIAIVVALIVLALAIFVFAPLEFGCNRFFLLNMVSEPGVGEVTYAFKHNYKNIVKVMFMVAIRIFLWSLLFIIPGIIKAYQYRMVPYILAEDDSMSYQEALERSTIMMNGNKMDAFIYDLSFIGWYILGAITCGIVAIFHVGPWKASSDAALYVALRNAE